MARLALISYSDGRFDARSRRVARSAVAAGHRAVMYARWTPGLPLDEEVDGLRIVRVPTVVRLAIPGLRGSGRRELARIRAAARDRGVGSATPGRPSGPPPPPRPPGRFRRFVRRLPPVVLQPYRSTRALIGPFLLFPLRPIAWAVALEDVAQPADLWHGMWAGSLPALVRLRGRHGGRAIYDSRDVYLHSRVFDRMRPVLRDRFLWFERRWARRVDQVVTVNDAYADILGPLLGVPRPVVVRNCPDVFHPADEDRDRIRHALGLPATTAVVLYQGGLMTERGIEQSMDAILAVPDAHLVLMGFGTMTAVYRARGAAPPYAGRVSFIDPVPPEELLAWTASADIMLMAIQPTTLNHRHTTPQKLWEAIATGVPVVASDLPGMAAVIDEVGCGVTCEPTDPAAIAAAIRGLLARSPQEREAMRSRTLAAARERYHWDAQAAILLAAYERLLGSGREGPQATPSRR